MSARANRRGKARARRRLQGWGWRVRKMRRGMRALEFATAGLHYTLDADRRPVPATILEYLDWMREQPEYYPGGSTLSLASDCVGPLRVSTIFMGLDHNFGGLWSLDRREDSHVPVLWETMVFEDGFGALDVQERYVTEAGALAGHQLILGRVTSLVALMQATKLVGVNLV